MPFAARSAFAVFALALGAARGGAAAEPAPAARRGSLVTLQKTESGFQLLRNGAPYFIRGAGGDGDRALLAASGGNSIRTWGVDDAQRTLDDAQAHGLTVALGFWMGHERHGFKYDDPRAVKEQLERARAAVLKFKDHPALPEHRYRRYQHLWRRSVGGDAVSRAGRHQAVHSH